MRNLIPPTLCNGTRLQIKKLRSLLLAYIILTGCGTGKTVFIPRIPIIPSDLLFQFKCIQFPIKLAFAMTIPNIKNAFKNDLSLLKILFCSQLSYCCRNSMALYIISVLTHET